METGGRKRQIFYRKFISAEKCVLLDTMYVILHLAIQDTSVFRLPLHPDAFVTGLYLDKPHRLWQYIVEVDAI